MINLFIKNSLLLLLACRILLALRSQRIFMFFLFLELRVISFLRRVETKSSGILNYFLVQRWSSLLVIIRFFVRRVYLKSLCFFRGVLVKLGGAPLHFWFPSISANLSWKDNLNLFIFIKILPLYLFFLNCKRDVRRILGVLNCLVGLWGGLRVYCYRKILAYSSINHLGWILLRAVKLEFLIFYFLCYSLINVAVILNLLKLNLNFYRERIPRTGLLISLLSLRGLPPLFGFVPKWVVLNFYYLENIRVFWLILCVRVLGVFFYIRALLKTFMVNNSYSYLITNVGVHRIFSLRGIWIFISL